MIVPPELNSHSPYKFGEETNVLLRVDDATQEYVMQVHLLESGKYLDADFKYSDSVVDIPLTVENIPDLGGNFLRIKISTYYLTKPDLAAVKVVNTSDATDSYTFLLQFGVFYAFAPAMITVYGNLFDSNGRPIVQEPVTFTVLNSATAFDNSPLTMMTTTVLTDEQGRFEAKLNRAYDYLLAVNRLNYSKVIRLSEVADDVTTVEVLIGRGLVCD